MGSTTSQTICLPQAAGSLVCSADTEQVYKSKSDCAQMSSREKKTYTGVNVLGTKQIMSKFTNIIESD